ARCPSVSLPALRAPPQSSPARASSAVQEIPCPPPAPNIPVCTRQSRSTRETSFRSPPRHAQNPSPTPGSLPSPPASQNPLAANVSVSSAESAIPLPGTPDTPACGSPEFLLPPASTATSGIPTSVPLAPLPPSSFATPHRSAGSHIGSSTPPLPSARRSAAGSPESGSTASALPPCALRAPPVFFNHRFQHLLIQAQLPPHLRCRPPRLHLLQRPNHLHFAILPLRHAPSFHHLRFSHIPVRGKW